MVTRQLFFLRSTLFLTGLLILALATGAHAGNKKMMEKNAEELIMLNTMLLEQLGTIQKDGKIILSGDVVHRDGKIILKLHQLRQIGPADEEDIFSSETFTTDQAYKIFLKEETLSEIPMPIDDSKDN